MCAVSSLFKEWRVRRLEEVGCWFDLHLFRGSTSDGDGCSFADVCLRSSVAWSCYVCGTVHWFLVDSNPL